MAQHNFKQLTELDGRTLEGGGQLLRISLCLAALTSKPLKITNIRGNRTGGGGLKAQHLAGVKWLAHACNTHVEGAEKGSRVLLFKPGTTPGDLSPAFKKRKLDDGSQAYECRLDIGTAGSTGLALQAILPFILFTKLPAPLPIILTLSGGTNVSGSPSYEYITRVLLPTLHNIGFPQITASLGKRGWSQGGSSIGNFTLTIPPRTSIALPAFSLHPTDTTLIPRPSHLHAIFIGPNTCLSHFRSVLPEAIIQHFGTSFSLEAENLQITAEGSLHEKRIYLIIIATIPSSSPTSNPSSSSTLPDSYILARDWLYDRRVRTLETAASEMAERVVQDLAKEWRSGAYVDEHMRDQLVIFQALAHGRSAVYAGREVAEDGSGPGEELREPSLHARTAEWVAKKMLGVSFDAETNGCEGVGFGETADEIVKDVAGKIRDLNVS